MHGRCRPLWHAPIPESHRQKKLKWYMRIVHYFIVLAVNNSRLIYRHSLPKESDKSGIRMSLKTFSVQIAEGLTRAGKVSSSLNRRLCGAQASIKEGAKMKQLLQKLCDMMVCIIFQGMPRKGGATCAKTVTPDGAASNAKGISAWTIGRTAFYASIIDNWIFKLW